MNFQSPPLVSRPKLAKWMFERGIKPAEAARHIGVSAVTVRQYIRPFGDLARQVPSQSVLAKIIAWTQGDVTVADFYPPELSGRQADPEVLAAARAE